MAHVDDEHLKEQIQALGFRHTIDRSVIMTNGHIRVFFVNGGVVGIMLNPKRGPVIPRRKRKIFREAGIIR